MTSTEILNNKVGINELRFPLVSHTVYSDARFDSYVILKSEPGAEDFLDWLDKPMNYQVLRA
jgi:hypothetical protein